ncbi:MAG: cupin domain-containing protein [Terriglobia bacterium]
MHFFTARIPNAEAADAHPAPAMAQGDCPVLCGAPQTAGMRSGFDRLKPGGTVGWHTTGNNEESSVILHGRSEVRLEGQSPRPFAAPAFAYIPPSSRHNVAHTREEPSEYAYVIAPAQDKK